jgi:hypothetical protein
MAFLLYFSFPKNNLNCFVLHVNDRKSKYFVDIIIGKFDYVFHEFCVRYVINI